VAPFWIYMAQLWRNLLNCARFKQENGAVCDDLRHFRVEDEVSNAAVIK
jgi:hypothetical protein